MQKIYFLIYVLILTPFFAFAQFEGTVEFAFNDKFKNQSGSSKWILKGNKMKQENIILKKDNVQNFNILAEANKTNVWMIEDDKKEYHNISEDMMQPRFPPIDTVYNTGEKMTYLGYECEKVIVKDMKNQTTVWITRKIPFDIRMFGQITKGHPSLAGIYHIKMKGMPLKITTYNDTGAETFTNTVTNVVFGNVKDSDVTIPSTYKETPFPTSK